MNRRSFCRSTGIVTGVSAAMPTQALASLTDLKIDLKMPVLQEGPVSDREMKLFRECVNLFVSRYGLAERVSFQVVGESVFDDYEAGQTVIGLTRADKEVRLETREYKTIGFMNGKRLLQRVAPLRKLDYFANVLRKGKPTLWDSKFLEDHNAELLFRRAIFHEFGCNCFFDVLDNNLVRALNTVDIRSQAYAKGGEGNHRAHASYLSYFHVVDGKPVWRRLPLENAMRSFAEIFALRELGMLPETNDSALNAKVEIVYGEMNKFRRKQ